MTLTSEASAPVPVVEVRLELHATLYNFLSQEQIADQVRQTTTESIAGLLAVLGIPGEPQLAISSPPDTRQPRNRFLRLWVNDHLCRYPDELLGQIDSYTRGVRFDPSEKLLVILERTLDKESPNEADLKQLLEFLRLCCIEIIKLHPAVLLSRPQLEAYVAALPVPVSASEGQSGTWLPDSEQLLSILRAVLAMRISIRQKEIVARILADAQGNQGKSISQITEQLIVALRPWVVEIQLSPQYLQVLTSEATAEVVELFASARDDMFVELGFRYPGLQFSTVSHLQPNSFAFTINHLPTPGMVGLEAGQCMVKADPAEARRLLGGQVISCTNPATGEPASIISSTQKDHFKLQGIQTWDQLSYLILAWASVFRTYANLFLNQQLVEEQLSHLEQAFPTLVRQCRMTLSIEELTWVLRALVAEEIGVRDLKSILEHLLDFEELINGTGHGVKTTQQELDEVRNQRLSYVRAGMQRYIIHKYTRGSFILPTCELDEPLTELIGAGFGGELEADLITDQVHDLDTMFDTLKNRSSISAFATDTELLALLTHDQARLAVSRLIALELPMVRVMSPSEIPLGTMTYSVGKVSLSNESQGEIQK